MSAFDAAMAALESEQAAHIATMRRFAAMLLATGSSPEEVEPHLRAVDEIEASQAQFRASLRFYHEVSP
jgi:hypothetical protein